MRGERGQLDVLRLDPDHPDRIRALNLIFHGDAGRYAHGGSRPRPTPPVAHLLTHVRRTDTSIDLLFGAYRRDRLVSASVALASPGGAGLVFTSLDGAGSAARQGIEVTLTALCERAWATGLSLLEVLFVPEASANAPILQRAGFRFLTRLLYLERRTDRPVPQHAGAAGLTWLPFSSDRESLFCAALEQSYVQSLDCPGLKGLRATPAVLAGHRAVGEHDPDLWWVALRNGAPCGVLLLTRIPTMHALEIVYMGVAQPARGTGVGDALLARAALLARQESAKRLSLAVDRGNTPARALYARWGFAQTGRRDAWIASPSPP
ncbi:MAG: GNAT family N-acetyltransferase [Phycisphaerae bacterium]